MSELPRPSLDTYDPNTDHVDEPEVDDSVEKTGRLERVRVFGRGVVKTASRYATTGGEFMSSKYRSKVADPISDRLEERRQEKAQRAQAAKTDRDAAPERPLRNLRTDATEILGETHLRSSARGVSRDAAKLSHGAYVSIRNANQPRDDFLRWRQARLLEKAAKLDGRPRHANRKKMYEDRAAWRERQQDSRKTKRNKRIEKRDTANERREERYQQWIDHYVDKRIDRYYQRAIKQRMRDQGISPRNIFAANDRYQFLKRLPKEQKGRMIREIILDVREENIRRGRLDPSHSLPSDALKRPIRDALYHRLHQTT